MNAVEVKGLVKKYKDTVAVDNLNLEIKNGEFFSLLGTNGAGKTTTVKVLSCLTMPSQGDAIIFGKSVKSDPLQVKRCIGVSLQETAIAPNLSAFENLEFICRLQRDVVL